MKPFAASRRSCPVGSSGLRMPMIGSTVLGQAQVVTYQNAILGSARSAAELMVVSISVGDACMTLLLIMMKSDEFYGRDWL